MTFSDPACQFRGKTLRHDGHSSQNANNNSQATKFHKVHSPSQRQIILSIRLQRALGSLNTLLRKTAQLLSSSAKTLRISTADHGLSVDGDLVSLLEEEKGGHGGDAVCAGDVLDVVDVDLCEGEDVGDAVLCGEGLKDGGDGFAGGAPVGKEVDGDVGCRVEQGLELLG